MTVTSEGVLPEAAAEAVTPPENLLKARAVLSRFGGISAQTLWRYVNNPDLEFPKPLYICGVRYWVSGDIDAFVKRQRARIAERDGVAKAEVA